MSVVQCYIPLNVQFEITYRCNNHCIFCYNYNFETFKNEEELTTQEAVSIIKDLAASGVLSLNFNGGEPLVRDDFFHIVSVAKRLGLDIHMNTNVTLVDCFVAEQIAAYFPSICTTILSGDSYVHDRLSGRQGAFCDMLTGIRKLQEKSVYVAANIMLSKINLHNLNETFDLMRDCKIRSVLVTRYVPNGLESEILHISDEEFLDAVFSLYQYNEKYHCFDRIAFPQPFKLCHVLDVELRDRVAKSNIACNIGLCTASISPNGFLTPCNLVKEPVLGNLLEESFVSLWRKFDGGSFCEKEHLTNECMKCPDIGWCGGGCKGYNDAISANRKD